MSDTETTPADEPVNPEPAVGSEGLTDAELAEQRRGEGEEAYEPEPTPAAEQE